MQDREFENVRSFYGGLQHFCRKYHATYKQGRPVRHSQPLSFHNDWVDNKEDLYSMTSNTFEVPTVELTLTEDCLRKLINETDELDSRDFKEYLRLSKVLGEHFVLEMYEIKRTQEHEKRLRSNNSSLQQAWEQYQILLRLVDSK